MIYLIFAGSIVRMGGAQMYVSNKVSYMKSLGWKVKIFSGLSGSVLIRNLEEYKDGIIPQMQYGPSFYSVKTQERILNQIVGSVGAAEGERIVIESNTAHMSFWAELAAQRLGAQHFAFLLDELFVFEKGFTDFFRFKYQRNELSVINQKYYEAVLGSYDKRDPSLETILSASCNNVTEDIIDPRFDSIPYDEFDYVICSLGRLDKNYIPTVIKGFHDFADAHPDKRIAYVFIGNQPDGFVPDMNAEIDKALSAFSHVKVYQMGYVYPIPESFFDHVSAGAASAGSSRVLWSKKIPTVSMDANDGKPIGILGYTTQNTLFRDQEEPTTLQNLLKMILTDDGLAGMSYTPYEIIPYEKIFKIHMSFLDRMSKEQSYYDVRSVKLKQRKNIVKKIMINLLGFKTYRMIITKIKR